MIIKILPWAISIIGVAIYYFYDVPIDETSTTKQVIALPTTSKNQTIQIKPDNSKKVKKRGQNSAKTTLREHKDVYTTKIEYYEDGITIHKKIEYKNNIKHGLEREFRRDGNLLWERTYVDGLLENDEIRYFPNGEISQITPYVKGLRNGTSKLYRLYYINGALNRYLIKTTEYENDLKNGYEYENRLCGVNTVLLKKIHYLHGLQDKTSEAYDCYERIIFSKVFDDKSDKITSTLFDENGVPFYKIERFNNKQSSIQEGYNTKNNVYYTIQSETKHVDVNGTKNEITTVTGIAKYPTYEKKLTKDEIKQYTQMIQDYFLQRRNMR